MQRTIKIFATLAFGATILNSVQRGSAYSAEGKGTKQAESVSRQASKLNTTDEQRLAFLKCWEATERARKLIDQIVGPGTRWRYDFEIFPGREAQLRIALSEMIAAHQQFRKSLNEEQRLELAKHLGPRTLKVPQKPRI